MRRVLLLFAALAAFAAAGAQPAGRAEHGPDRETFVYAVRDGDSLRLDRYPALSSAAGARPCMIFLFGGGFLTGTRDHRRFLPYFRHFTARGCDVVSIDYRLGMKRALDAGPIDGERFPGVLASTLAMATEDLRDATAFVCRRAAEWGVDPQRILTSGSSAGAMTVLMAEYALCNGDSVFVRHLPEGFRYAGVIAYAGAVYDPSSELRWATPPAPLLLFHGDADRNVPYDTVPVPGGGVLFGSAAVARDLAQRGVPYWFVSEAGADHSMAWRPMREHFAEIDAFLDRFVFGGERRRFETRIVPPDAPERPAVFAIDDYLDANYGHYVSGKKRQPSETFRKGYRQ